MLLTETLLSSVLDCVVLASIVVSDIPPEGCVICGPIYGTCGTTRVDGIASAFLYPFVRARDTPYGWNHPVGIISALVGPALGQLEVSTSPCGKRVGGVVQGDRGTQVLTM